MAVPEQSPARKARGAMSRRRKPSRCIGDDFPGEARPHVRATSRGCQASTPLIRNFFSATAPLSAPRLRVDQDEGHAARPLRAIAPGVVGPALDETVAGLEQGLALV